MRTPSILIVLMAFLLSACGPQTAAAPTAVPSADAVATQVSIMLTEMPTFTPAPVQAATSTLAPIVTETPTEMPTVTVTATQPPTETPTVTPPSGDPVTRLGEPDWKTSFDSGRSFGEIDNENTFIRTEDGALVLTGKNANGWLGWSMTFSQKPKDFYIDATFNTQSCSGSDQYGLLFRAPNTMAAYFFGVTCDGSYFLEANDFNEGGFESVPVAKTSNSILKAGANQTNRLGVMAQGDKIGLYANGVLLQEVSDALLPEAGYFGAVIAAQETAGFTVRMEDISMWNLP